MRILGVLVVLAACGKSSGPAQTGTGSGSASAATKPQPPPAAVPPGLGAKVELPAPAKGYRTMKPQRFRHSSVRGDFRVYRTAEGIVTSWKTLLSARTVDGKPLWKKEDQGRAVAVSPDGKRIVTNNQAGELLVLDAKYGAQSGTPVMLGGPSDGAHPDVWISAFAWLPDGKHILALDSKHVYVLGDDGKLQRELPIKCKEDDCFFSSAVALSNDEAIIASSAGTSTGQLLRIELADGATLAAADFYGHDVDLSADHANLVVDSSGAIAMFDPVTLAPRWNVALPGFRGVKMAKDTGWTEWKSVPKLSPDGAHVVVNDAAGRLWLLDAKTGAPELAYPTELVDFVEDVMWLDGSTLVAIDNPGHVLRISGTPARAAWSEMDGPTDGEWDGP